MTDEKPEVKIARLEERLKAIEADLKGINSKLWAGVAVIATYVGNQLLGLIGK